MAMTSGPDGLGTRMRHVLEVLDGDVAKFLADIGLDGYRPRYSGVVRALLARGPLAIRDLAAEVGVTHSAASQTVAQMNRAGFVALEPGADARQRIVSLTAKTRELLPLIEAEWTATTEASEALEAELPAAEPDDGHFAAQLGDLPVLHAAIQAHGPAYDRPSWP